MDCKHVKDNFGSIRRITILTPDTFTRNLLIVSTVFSNKANAGETKTKQEAALNSFAIKDLNYGDWKAVKKHRSLKKALEFHDDYVGGLGFCDCDVTKEGD